MVRIIISVFIMSVVALTGYNQHIEEIKEYNTNDVAHDVAMDDSGNFYIAGHIGNQAMVLKMDTMGNEIWYKSFLLYEFNNYNNEYEVHKIIPIESTNELLIHGSTVNRYDHQWLMKLDSEGNRIWLADSIPNDLYLRSGFAYKHFEEVVLLAHYDDQWGMKKYDIQTGENIYNKTFSDLEKPLDFHMNSADVFYDNSWQHTSGDKVFSFSPNGDYKLKKLNSDSLGAMLGATDLSYLTYAKYYKLFPNLTSIWSCDLKIFDNNWSLQNVVEVKSKLHDSHDTVDMSVNSLKASNDFGIFGVGNTGYKTSNGWNYYVWYSQINPDDGITVWDTLLPYGPSGQFVASKKNTIITVGSIGASNTGMLIRKINLPSIPFQTEFVSDEQDIPVKANQADITIYPNPSNSFYNIESGKRIKQVSVYDLRGSLIMQKPINSKRSRIQLENTGVYLMRIEDVDGNIITKKVVRW